MSRLPSHIKIKMDMDADQLAMDILDTHLLTTYTIGGRLTYFINGYFIQPLAFLALYRGNCSH